MTEEDYYTDDEDFNDSDSEFEYSEQDVVDSIAFLLYEMIQEYCKWCPVVFERLTWRNLLDFVEYCLGYTQVKMQLPVIADMSKNVSANMVADVSANMVADVSANMVADVSANIVAANPENMLFSKVVTTVISKETELFVKTPIVMVSKKKMINTIDVNRFVKMYDREIKDLFYIFRNEFPNILFDVFQDFCVKFSFIKSLV